ncbi:MAG: class I SAM-dependent methyltransferase [Clostridia bacterium]|nr:class I SAM-dependent methyltransferase [Clostridia bacterium]
MIQWNETSIRLMSDFAVYTGFYTELAKALLPHLNRDGHICDAGCGLGYLGAALAKEVRRVTGVERNPEAATAAQALHENTANFSVLNGDIHLLPPEERYDDMVFCFFGNLLESLLLAKRQATGKAVIIKRDLHMHRFSMKYVEVNEHTFVDAEHSLREWEVPFETFPLSLEAGQPFMSLKDGVDFFNLYSRDVRSTSITEEEVFARLVKGREPFPYYLPMKRNMGVIIVDTKNIEGEKIWKRLSHLS